MRIWTLTAIILLLLIASLPVNPKPWAILLLFCYLVMTFWRVFLPKNGESSVAIFTFKQVFIRAIGVLGLIAICLVGLDRLQQRLDHRLPNTIDHQVFSAKAIITANSIRSHSDLAFERLDSKSIKLDVSLIELTSTSLDTIEEKLAIDRAKVRLSYYPLGFGYRAYNRVRQNQLSPKSLLTQFDAGKVICFEAKLRRPRGLLNFTGFDYEKWLVEQGYFATGYIKSLFECDDKTQDQLPWYQAWRLSVIAALNELFDEHQWASSDIMLALITGSKERMTLERKEWLAQSGLSHLVVISGLHIGLIMAVVYGLLYQFVSVASSSIIRFKISPRVIASVFAILAAWGYCLLAGFSASAMRAAIMGTALCLARAYGLKWPVISGLLLAMLLLLLLNPLNALASGFWLSFGAVFMIYWAIIFARIPRSSRRSDRSKKSTGTKLKQGGIRYIRPVISGFWQLVKVQFALLLLLTPIVLFTVETFHLASFVTNLICVPVFSLVIVPALLLNGLIYTLLPGLGSLGFDAINTLLNLLLGWVDTFMHLEQGVGLGNWGEYVSLEVWSLALALFALLLLVYFRFALGVIPFFLLMPLLFAPSDRPNQGEAHIDIIDVGQGLAILVQTQGYRLVYDTGANFGSFDIGEQVVVPMLKLRESRGLFINGASIESDLVISHADMDHAGGASRVLSYMSQGTGSRNEIDIYSGEPERLAKTWLRNHDARIQSCHGHSWERDGVQFSFARQPLVDMSSNRHQSKPNGQKLRSNNQSCVLKITAGGSSILLTGDIEGKAESSLLQRCEQSKKCDQFKSDVMVVAHHGSNTSSRQDFIQAVNPGLAIASNGYKNRFRHPHPKVVSRFREQQIEFTSTAESGGLFIRLPHLSVQKARDDRMRPWYLRADSKNNSDESL